MQKLLIAALLTLAFAMTACNKPAADPAAAPAEGAAPAAAPAEGAK